MNQKQRRGKHPTSNINININLKVDTKHNQPAGKKIMQQKEVHKVHQPLRPNHTIETVAKKKLSCQESNKYKYTLQDLGQERQQNWYNLDQRYNQCAANRLDKQNMLTKNSKTNLRKRLKSKSLQNLKVKYYARTPESVSKSHSKINSKSKSKSKSKSRKCKENEVPSPKSFLHSQKKKSVSRSKSKSPLISKKRSLQTFKTREDISNRDTQKDKSKDIKKQKVKEKEKEKNPATIKKNQNQTGQKSTKTHSNITMVPKKLTEPIKNNTLKSKQKLKHYSPQKHPKQSISGINKTKVKKTKKSKKDTHIYPQIYLDKMATKIQSLWRGFIVRKRLKEELNQIHNKIATVRNQINIKDSIFWQTQSNHSIIQLQSETNKTVKSESVKNHSHRSALNQSNNISPQFMVQIEKLRKKLEQQQDRFKVLQLQNNELKANLNKIGSEVKVEPKKENKKLQKELQMNRVVSLRIQSQQSEKDMPEDKRQEKKKEISNKRRDLILGLPAAIKTQQSKQEQEYAEMKKKMQYYQCSPKNQSGFNVKFNKNILKKLFVKQEEKLNEKYFKKSKQFTDMLKNQLVSPKTYQLKCVELENRFSREKAQYVNKYQQAQKALLLIDQIQQQQQQNSIIEKQNENKPNNYNMQNIQQKTDLNKKFINSYQNEAKVESPYKKTINLFINVDQIQTNAEKYPPLISSNSHREHQVQVTNQQDLSELYQKVMQQRQISAKRQDYLQKEQQQIKENKNEKSPEYYRQQAKNTQMIASKTSDESQFRGFQTNLKYIRSFYIKFCEFFRQIENLRQEVQENISSQLMFDKEMYLKSYRTYEQDSNSNQSMFPYFKLFATYNIGIPIQILNHYYQELTDKDSQLYHSITTRLKDNSKQECRQLGYSVYQLKQYHDLALMDAFNESINFERPGGPHGSNLDELTHHYHTINKNRVISKLNHDLKSEERQQNLNIILGNTIGRVINEWACGLCGFINDASQQGQQLNQSKIEEVRMQRLTLMLQKALLDQQSSMTNIYPFQLAVKMQIQKHIFSFLMNEMVLDLQKVKQKQANL